MKSFVFFEMVVVVGVLLLCVMSCSAVKECTNTPTPLPLASHTVRHELLTSNNETWKKEMYAHYHLTPTDESAWANLLPRKILKEDNEFNWMMMYRKMKHTSGAAKDGFSSEFLNEVPLGDVRLDPGSFHGQAQQTNLEYLLLLDVDDLVWSFRRTAGLPTAGNPYGGWEAPKEELRGHFVGHYLSATARMWASTGNDTIKERMDAVVSILSECQDTMGSGYLSAFPTEFFDRFEAIQPVWAPYYTIHKIMQGLVDQYIFGANSRALKMASRMADYFYKRVQNVISRYTIERHWMSLNEETGGMNDVLYRLFSITGDTKHLLLAHLFDKPCFLGLLAIQADDIADLHTNTHIPVLIGAQMRYEVTGDHLYKEMGMFFMDIVNSSHSYATGGTSNHEFWHNPKRIADALGTETEESCTTYNMLKVSRHLFRWTREPAYADYYERALTNGVLGIQRQNQPGVMIYMLPLDHGVSKAVSYHGWGTQFNSFWCCYGTGIESFSKLGDSIYFEDGANAGLYIIQYISSSLDWKSGNITLNQKVEPAVSWDPRLLVAITISPKKEGGAPKSTLNFRIPSWTNSNGVKASLNGQSLPLPAPGNFLSVTRNWSPNDTIALELPLSLRSEAIQDDRANYSSLHAFLYGPYLLAGLTTGDWDIKADPSVSPSELITPIPADYNSHLISLSQESGKSTFALAHLNNTITMVKFPEPGTNTSVHATFRLLFPDGSKSKISSVKDVIGKSVKLEPFDLPGMLLMQQGKDKILGLGEETSSSATDFAFRLVVGLDGNNGTVSLESEQQKGCYVYSEPSSGGRVKKHLSRNVDLSGGIIKLICGSVDSSVEFEGATSFLLRDGISSYHPLSFVAKGLNRNYLLAPLFTIADEHYNVYFNVTSS